MNMTTTLDHLAILLQLLLAAALAWSSFCRMVLMDHRTRDDVRLAIWAQGVAAGFVLGAPFMPLLWHWAAWPPGDTPAWVCWACWLVARRCRS